jgi:serine/threonine protein kinase
MRSWGKSRVKLIDFGSSCFQGQQVFEYLQSRYYRAPEVMLRRPYSYEIDMWSFACLLLELRLGEPVFAANNNTQQLMYIANSIGMPDPSHGRYSRDFLESN